MPYIITDSRGTPEAVLTQNEVDARQDLYDYIPVTVDYVSWADLADLADCFPVPWSRQKILQAFNRRSSK